MGPRCDKLALAYISPPTATRTHHIHDRQDVLLNVLAAVVLHHLGVGHHQGLHPLLLADGARLDLALPLLLLFPPLSAFLRLLEAFLGFEKEEVDFMTNGTFPVQAGPTWKASGTSTGIWLCLGLPPTPEWGSNLFPPLPPASFDASTIPSASPIRCVGQIHCRAELATLALHGGNGNLWGNDLVGHLRCEHPDTQS